MVQTDVTQISRNARTVNNVFRLQFDNTQLTDHQAPAAAGRPRTATEDTREGPETPSRFEAPGPDQQARLKEAKQAYTQVRIEAAFNRITKANVAQEQVEYTKQLILQKSSIVLKTQANISEQGVLQLLG